MTATGVRFRAVLYFLIAALPEIITALYGLLKGTERVPPGMWHIFWSYVVLKSLLGGFVALRAYYDGSAERHSQEQKNGNGNGHLTPTPPETTVPPVTQVPKV